MQILEKEDSGEMTAGKLDIPTKRRSKYRPMKLQIKHSLQQVSYNLKLHDKNLKFEYQHEKSSYFPAQKYLSFGAILLLPIFPQL